jgi:hypothetical protein
MTLKKIFKGSLLIFVAFGLSVVPWHGSGSRVMADHVVSFNNRVAIPDIGSGLVHQQVLVTTGRTGNVEFPDQLFPSGYFCQGCCNGFSFTAARYGVLTGQAQEHYDKHHWDHDPGNGARVSSFSSQNSCVVGSTTYNVYDVIVEEK